MHLNYLAYNIPQRIGATAIEAPFRLSKYPKYPRNFQEAHRYVFRQPRRTCVTIIGEEENY